MSTSISPEGLRAAAATWLASADLEVTAWEARHQARTVALVQQFQAGTLDAAALRAALTDGSTPRTRPAPAAPAIAVVPLRGVLVPSSDHILAWLGLGTSVTEFRERLRAAVADAAVTAIVVDVDSPGGSVRGVTETAQAVRAARAQKPIVAFVSGLDASAAFWITANATRLVATPSAEVGSVGIIGERRSVTRALAQNGIDVHVIASSPEKMEGHPAVAMTDAEHAHLRARCDELFATFVADVAHGRGVSVSRVREDYGKGRTLSAAEALTARMIDEIATAEQFGARLASGSLPAAKPSDPWRAELVRAQLRPYREAVARAAAKCRS